jgi:periplasmic copper chaperone A
MSRSTTLARLGALPAAGAVVLLSAAPASAHVSISPSDGTAGAYSVLTASVPHGCDGSPTTRVAMQIPEQILSVTPTRHPFYDVRRVMEKLDEPVTDAHGNEVTERVGQIVYTANDPLPEGQRDAFELSLQLPDTPGETLVFPTVQTCEQGETAWVEVGEEGSDEELEAPAPTVTVLPAEEGDGHGSSDATADEASAEAEDRESTDVITTTSSGEDASALSVAALVAGLLGLAAGVGALVMARRRS